MRQAEDGVPAKCVGQQRREQRGESRAAVACAGDAHRQALILRRIPAAGQRQRGGETGPGHAEHHSRPAALSRSCQPIASPAPAESPSGTSRDTGLAGADRSVITPSTRRRTAPPNSGTASISPLRVAQPKCESATIEFASAPSNTQTMKLMSKYRNAEISDRRVARFQEIDECSSERSYEAVNNWPAAVEWHASTGQRRSSSVLDRNA